jgi:DNA repair ATPase RecN
MEKTLLQSFTGNTETKANTGVVMTSADDKKALSELMQEMKSQLDDAAADLMQPRQKVLDTLLDKILH